MAQPSLASEHVGCEADLVLPECLEDYAPVQEEVSSFVTRRGFWSVYRIAFFGMKKGSFPFLIFERISELRTFCNKKGALMRISFALA